MSLLWALRSFRRFPLHYITQHFKSKHQESSCLVIKETRFSLSVCVCLSVCLSCFCLCLCLYMYLCLYLSFCFCLSASLSLRSLSDPELQKRGAKFSDQFV